MELGSGENLKYINPFEREEILNSLHYFDNSEAYFNALMAWLTDAEPKTIKNIKNIEGGVFRKLEENAKLKLGDPNLRHYAELLLESIEVELGRRQLLKKRVSFFMAHAKEDEILACAEKANICLESGFMKIDCGLILDLAAKEIKKRNPGLKPEDLHESLDIDIYLSDFDDDDYDYSDWDAYFVVEQEIYREEGGVDDRSPYSSEDIYRGEDEGWIYED